MTCTYFVAETLFDESSSFDPDSGIDKGDILVSSVETMLVLLFGAGGKIKVREKSLYA